MKTRFINYLYFSRKERLGSIVLLFFCIAVFVSPAILQSWRPRTVTDFSDFEATIRAFRQSASASEDTTVQCFDFDPNLASAEDFQRLGLSEKVAQNICHYREKGGSFRQPEDFKKIWSLHPDDYARLLPYIRIGATRPEQQTATGPASVAQPFPFDPNTATEEQLLRLGLPGRTVKSILNYRSKGGTFRKKTDLSKIFTLDEEDYTRLEPYISISGQGNTRDSLRPVAYAGAGMYYPQKNIPKSPIDLNNASAEELMRLPLVGEKRASQIISFREKLGGFLSIQQLSEMYNLPDSVFQRIQPMLTVSGNATRKINLNTASLDALDAHPYISKKQAELITAYRAQHGNYTRPDEVLNIKAFTDKAWWEKISPYLAVQ